MKVERYECDWCGTVFEDLNVVRESVIIDESFAKPILVEVIFKEEDDEERMDLCIDCQRKALTQAAQQFEKAEGV